MTRLKDILLENGTLTDATDGFDSTAGTPSLDTTSKLKGANSILCSAVGDWGEENFTGVDTLYVSAYILFSGLPATNQSRVLRIFNTTDILCTIYISSAGAIQLRDTTNTQIGSASGVTVTINNPFRIGLRYTKGTGADGILEAFAAAGDDAFGAAFASTSTHVDTLQANRVRAGQNTGGTVCTVYVDNVRIDDAAMPGPDGGAPPTGNPYYAIVQQ